MAEALWLNDILRHFSWTAGRTRLTDRTGQTLAQAAQLGLKKHVLTCLTNLVFTRFYYILTPCPRYLLPWMAPAQERELQSSIIQFFSCRHGAFR